VTADAWATLIALLLLFGLEGVWPFDRRRAHRLRHGWRNLQLALISGVVTAASVPLLFAASALAAERDWGLVHQLDLDPLASTVLAFVLFDLWMYLWHRANHEIPLLWRFHRVHHTDPEMDCTTALRFHPIEIFLSSGVNAVVILALGMAVTDLVLYKTVMVVVILLHHSNVAIPERIDRRLRTVIVSPAVHRVHHSEVRDETDSNYGTVFSFWDRLFGSLRLRGDTRAIRFGIGRFAESDWQRLAPLLSLPFRREVTA
jgi:sterol desaturase/sphingolipid hydroxylase (fatty acid hydroxylase superfamily)